MIQMKAKLMYVWKKVDEGVETALAVTDDLFLIEGMEVSALGVQNGF